MRTTPRTTDPEPEPEERHRTGDERGGDRCKTLGNATADGQVFESDATHEQTVTGRGRHASCVADLLEAAPIGGLDLEGAVLDVEEAG